MAKRVVAESPPPSELQADWGEVFNAWWQTPQRIGGYWAELARQTQQLTGDAAAAMRADASTEAAEVRGAADLPSVLALQGQWLAEQWALAGRMAGQWFADWLDFQTRCARDLEAGSARWAQASADATPDAGPGLPGLDPSAWHNLTPAAAWRAGQQAWADACRLWVNAAGHDLKP